MPQPVRRLFVCLVALVATGLVLAGSPAIAQRPATLPAASAPPGLVALAALPQTAIQPTGSPAPVASAGDIASATPIKVAIGLYIIDIAHLDLKESQFFADFYIWYKVAPEVVGTWTPDSIEFMNGSVQSATPIATDTAADGRICWWQRVKGTFRGRFNLHLYPFDSQVLPLVIEDNTLPVDRLVLVPDTAEPLALRNWVEKAVQVPDWTIDKAEARTDVHEYRTDFGLTAAPTRDTAATRYSRFAFAVYIDRLFVPHFIKFIIPLLVIAGMAYVVFWINAREFQAQCGITVTALLSAVALHISQADALPAVGYLVIADKIFILFYLVIFSALVQTVIVNNYAKKRHLEWAQRFDEMFRLLFPLFLIGGTLIIIITC